MRISEIMAVDPITVADDAVLGEAVRVMDRNGVRHLPVLRAGALVGVLSDRDVYEPSGRLVPSLRQEGELDPPLVRSVMQPTPLTVTPEATVGTAAAMLRDWGVGCLPVTRGAELLGLVTETDLLRVLGARAGDAAPPVRACMSVAPETVAHGETLERAARRMSEGDFRHLPVTDAAGRLVAVLSDRDLRRAAGRGLPPTTPLDELELRRPITADADETLSSAARRMMRHRIGALPVVERERRLTGILTVTDLLAHLARTLD